MGSVTLIGKITGGAHELRKPFGHNVFRLNIKFPHEEMVITITDSDAIKIFGAKAVEHRESLNGKTIKMTLFA